jgi:hypothetical protein
MRRLLPSLLVLSAAIIFLIVALALRSNGGNAGGCP